MNLEPRTGNWLDDDLSSLSAEDLARVCRYIQDRVGNAICPLSIRLQMEMPGTIAADKTLQQAIKTVERLTAVMAEVGRLANAASVRGSLPAESGQAGRFEVRKPQHIEP